MKNNFFLNSIVRGKAVDELPVYISSAKNGRDLGKIFETKVNKYGAKHHLRNSG